MVFLLLYALLSARDSQHLIIEVDNVQSVLLQVLLVSNQPVSKSVTLIRMKFIMIEILPLLAQYQQDFVPIQPHIQLFQWH